MSSKSHWEQVYSTKAPFEFSWFQASATRSLELLDLAGPGDRSDIIDIGGGDSRLVDALLQRPHRAIAVLDISQAALDRAKVRLGSRAAEASPSSRYLPKMAPRAAVDSMWFATRHRRSSNPSGQLST